MTYRLGLLFVGLWFARTALGAVPATNLLQLGVPTLDRPTVTALGIQLPISGDDNFNAIVGVRYRISGTVIWRTGLPLFRVHPETVANWTVIRQFAGSIFDLSPGTAYDVELHATDPDGVDQILTLTGTTRGVPHDPVAPVIRNVSNGNSLQSALNAAQPGDIISLANGTYSGVFQMFNAGTPDNPIVIRGASEDGVILDGGNCIPCNIMEVYGAGYVHLERMTMRNGERAIRFQSSGAIGNAVRFVHIQNTVMGIGGRDGQMDFYIADNILEGRLLWPHVYSDDAGLHANDDGIAVFGFGHVVSHNRISGYGDAMKTEQDGARANDFFGNDILFTYDNGIELDASEGNARCFRNRFMNTFNTLSVQPVHGGPDYLLRNVVINVVTEQMKFHALATTPQEEPSGVLAYHNTFVSPSHLALQLETPAVSHYFEIENNLFVGQASSGQQVVDWTGPIDHGTFDYNGYFPDGIFRFNNPAVGGYFLAPNFAALQGLGMEQHGTILNGTTFANGMAAPASYIVQLSPADATLASGSPALDKGRILSNINDGFLGAAPDLGALEKGCPMPTYGPRADGIDERNEVIGCDTSLHVPSPTADAVTSNGTSGASQSYTFRYSSPNGYGYLNYVYALFNNSLNGAGACWVSYQQSDGNLYLIKDNGDGVIGPLGTNPAASIQNGQCTLFRNGSSVSGSGNTLTLIVNVTFYPAFGNIQQIYTGAVDRGGRSSDWQSAGATGPPIGGIPSADSAVTGAGNITLKYSSKSGFQYLSAVALLVNSTVIAQNACLVYFVKSTGSFYLINDAGDTFLGPLTPGGAGTLVNSQCTLTGLGSSVAGSGNTLTTTLQLSFSPAFGPTHNVYLYAADQAGMNSGWQKLGTVP